MFEIWDGDLFLYTVDSTYEADEAEETGFRVVPISQEQQGFSVKLGNRVAVNFQPGDSFVTGVSKMAPVFLTFFLQCYILAQ